MALTFAGVVLRPTERGLERGFRNYCFADLDGMCDEMGERWEAMAAYALDRFRTPTVRAAMRRLMRPLASAIPPHDLARITVPTTLIWGRHDRGVRPNVATLASERYGWALHVIEGAPRRPGHRTSTGLSGSASHGARQPLIVADHVLAGPRRARSVRPAVLGSVSRRAAATPVRDGARADGMGRTPDCPAGGSPVASASPGQVVER